MSGEKVKKHIPVPKETPAFICANCGAVALDPGNICKVMGRGKKADWCGIKQVTIPSFCHNKVHNLRYKCANCGQVAVNPELLCEPEKMKEQK
jgi:uncharacterized OB-fold protein